MFRNSVYSDYTNIRKKKIGIPNPNGHYDPKVPPTPNSKSVI